MSRSEEYDPMPDRSIFRSALRAAGALAAIALSAGCSPFQTTRAAFLAREGEMAAATSRPVEPAGY